MSNTERIRQEIERRIGAMYNFSSGYSALNTCRELLDFIDSLPKETPQGLDKAAEDYINNDSNKTVGQAWLTRDVRHAFINGAKWQREQDHDACYQCEKNYDNVFFKGEQHAIKMMKEEAVEGKCVNVCNAGAVIDTDYGCLYLPPESFKVDDLVKIYIFKEK